MLELIRLKKIKKTLSLGGISRFVKYYLLRKVHIIQYRITFGLNKMKKGRVTRLDLNK